MSPETAGPRLRAKREQLGRTIEELAKTTRIPAAHIEALEDGRLEELPAGPYAGAYVRTLAGALGLPSDDLSDEEAPTAPEPPRGAPLWMVRALAVSSLFALFVVIASWAWERVQRVVDTPRVVSAVPDQELVVSARRSTRVKVVVDGDVALDGEVAGGDRHVFQAKDRLEVEVGELSALSLRWNGVDLVPQGIQDAPRRLVFVDDLGGADWP